MQISLMDFCVILIPFLKWCLISFEPFNLKHLKLETNCTIQKTRLSTMTLLWSDFTHGLCFAFIFWKCIPALKWVTFLNEVILLKLRGGLQGRIYTNPDLYGRGIAVSSHCDRHRKLLHEDGQRPQLAREDKVKQRPQLLQIVLHGRAWQDEPVWSAKLEKGKRESMLHIPKRSIVFSNMMLLHKEWMEVNSFLKGRNMSSDGAWECIKRYLMQIKKARITSSTLQSWCNHEQKSLLLCTSITKLKCEWMCLK